MGAATAAAVQMHYLALILLPIFAILWIKELLAKKGTFFWRGTIVGIVTFLLLMSPLLIFDLKHDFLNYKSITGLLTQTDSVGGNIWENILRIPQIFSFNLIGRYMAGENLYLTLALSALVIFALLRKSWPVFCLSVWLIIGLLGISFYQKDIFDHYLGFLNPVPFLLLGSVFALVKARTLKTLSIIFIIIISIINLSNSPLKNPPNNQLQRTQNVAKFIIDQLDEKPFNFALLAERNYDAAYQFYLEQFGHKPKLLPFEKTEQLFVVCENPVCDPVYSAKYEVAAFGWRLIEKEWNEYGVRIFKIVHNPEEDRQ